MSKVIKTTTVAMVAFGMSSAVANEVSAEKIAFDSKVGEFEINIKSEQNETVDGLLLSGDPWPTCNPNDGCTKRLNSKKRRGRAEEMNLDAVSGKDIAIAIS